MKTLSDFKKMLHKGMKLKSIYHNRSTGQRDEKGNLILSDGEMIEREVSIVQSNSFALKTLQKDGTCKDSWMQYPKASEVQIDPGKSITILIPDFRERNTDKMIPCVTYFL